MKILYLILLFALVGCDTGGPKNRFFDPEVSGAVYAARQGDPDTPESIGDPTADDSRSMPQMVTKLQVPNSCYWTKEYGWTCTGSYWDENGEYTLSDNAGDYNAARSEPVFDVIDTP